MSNILLASLLHLSAQLIPIVGLIVLHGWLAEVHRRLVAGYQDPYVRFEFADLSQYVNRGAVPFAASFVLTLAYLCVGGGIVLALVVLGALGQSVTQSSGPILMVLVGLGVLLLVPLSAGFMVLFNAVMTRAEVSGDLRQALALRPVLEFARATWRSVLLRTLVFSLLACGLLLLGLLACVIGVVVAVAVTMIAHMHLRWQFYQDYLARGGEPIPLPPYEPLKSELQGAGRY